MTHPLAGPPLIGKTALVTGASRGIGRAIALRLARDGARVAVHYGRDRAAADRTVAEIAASGGQGVAAAGDLSDPAASVPALFAALDAAGFGTLDIVVNSAGVAEGAAITGAGSEAVRTLFAVNVAAVWEVTHHAASRLRDGGRIVNVTTGATRVMVMPAYGAYAATKAAVDQFTRHWAQEFGARGITVNAVAPGHIATDMNAFDRSEESRAGVLAQQALQRVGQPEDVADVVGFLCGPDARWVTGQRLEASGGWQL